MANADVFKSMSKRPSEMTSEDIYGPVTAGGSGASQSEIYGAVQPGAGGPGTKAPAAPEAPPAEPTEVGRAKGSGGYEYATMSDGTIKITKSPRGGAGTVVTQDSEFYDLIKADIAKFMAPGKPAAPKAAAPAAPSKAPSKAAPAASMPEARGRANSPSGQSMQETEAERMATSEAGMPEDRMGESTPEEPDLGFSEDVADAMLDMTSEAGAPKPDTRAEMVKYSGLTVQGTMRRNQLRDAAAAGLTRGSAKLDRQQAMKVAAELAGRLDKGDYSALVSLKTLAAM